MGFNLDKNKVEKVGEIGNYYGGLYIKKIENKYYWIIENYDTDFNNIDEWDEISERLFLELCNEFKI
jgi:hypothetical protein